MHTYVLNQWENKVEVYITRYCIPGKRPKFYGGATLGIYRGSIKDWGDRIVFNRNHWQTEQVWEGDHSNRPYYGGREGSYKFKILTRQEVIDMFKHKNQQP